MFLRLLLLAKPQLVLIVIVFVNFRVRQLKCYLNLGIVYNRHLLCPQVI